MKELIGNIEARWLFFFAAAFLPAVHVQAIVPTPAAVQEVAIPIAGATIHSGNGTVIESGVITFAEGKITAVSRLDAGVNFSDYQVIEMAGKHNYPGFILPNTTLGLVEVTSVRATHDVLERGELNPNARSIVAYNTDSELIPALCFNGILTVQIRPRGALVGGFSSIVQLNGWNWEAALTMITRSNAEIIGIADGVGTLEAGKDGTLFVCQGHALDMRGNQLLKAFIQGGATDLNGTQQQFFERYQAKYSNQALP